jgi:hypothetical protein
VVLVAEAGGAGAVVVDVDGVVEGDVDGVVEVAGVMLDSRGVIPGEG